MKNKLVSVSWLQEHINNPNLMVLDATIPIVTENATVAKQLVIEGALFFDLKKQFSNTTAPFPNTVPTAAQFEEGCKKLGIAADTWLVIYDAKGVYSSARAWLLFMLMGHKNVAVLDGGLPEWIRLNGNCVSEHKKGNGLGTFKPEPNKSWIKSSEDMLNNIETEAFLVLDARSADRFLGKVPEPRADLKRGHIPKSANLPFTALFKDGLFLPPSELKQVFNRLGVLDTPLWFTCGSGITASILWFAAHLVLDNELGLYDGSWSEWGASDHYPIS